MHLAQDDATTAPAQTEAAPVSADRRMYSVDAFRGLTMVWLVSQGFGFLAFRNDPFLGPVAKQFTHVPWHGINAWDMIQPFFIFIVGMAMPFSYRRRWEAHEPWSRSLLHALRRSVLLLVLSAFERSIQTGTLLFDPMNVLAQIAAAYPFAFLVLLPIC